MNNNNTRRLVAAIEATNPKRFEVYVERDWVTLTADPVAVRAGIDSEWMRDKLSAELGCEVTVDIGLGAYAADTVTVTPEDNDHHDERSVDSAVALDQLSRDVVTALKVSLESDARKGCSERSGRGPCKCNDVAEWLVHAVEVRS